MTDATERSKLLHEFFNNQQRYWGTEVSDALLQSLPKDGLHVVFERGEQAFGMDRIVFVGTHDSNGNLTKRIAEHYLKKEKDRTILRKYIGLALINREGKNPWLLESWYCNFTNPKRRVLPLYSPEYLALKPTYEDMISDYLRQNTSFAVLPLPNSTKSERELCKKQLIATLSLANQATPPSDDWLGKYAYDQRSIESGMWNLQYVFDAPLAEDEWTELVQVLQAAHETAQGEE